MATTALITGGTSGIGRATANKLAQLGVHVVVVGRNVDRGEKSIADIRKAGGQADFIPSDLRDASSARVVARKALEVTNGQVDILVNNAGVYPFGPTHEMTEASFDEVYSLNVKAPYFLVAELAPLMAKRGKGAIVNLSTVVADYGAAGMSLYGSSKATPMIAWPAPSPSSPAPSARRYAALGLDRSVRPSKLADRVADGRVLHVRERKSTFTEISYTKLLTFPIGAHVRHPPGPAHQGTGEGRHHRDRRGQPVDPRGVFARPQRPIRQAATARGERLRARHRSGSARRDPEHRAGANRGPRQHRHLRQPQPATARKPGASPLRQGRVKVREYPDGMLAVFHGPRLLARYNANCQPIEGERERPKAAA